MNTGHHCTLLHELAIWINQVTCSSTFNIGPVETLTCVGVWSTAVTLLCTGTSTHSSKRHCCEYAWLVPDHSRGSHALFRGEHPRNSTPTAAD